MIRNSLLLALFAAGVAGAVCGTPREDRPVRAAAPAQQVVASEVERLSAALYRKVDVAFADASLGEVAIWLGEQLGVPATVDRETFEAAGIAPDVAFNLSLKQVSLFAAMVHLFGETEIAWTIHNGELLLTTADRAKACEIVRVYPVGDFVLRRDKFGRVFVDEHELGAASSGGCWGPRWDLDGDFSFVEIYDDLMVVRHSWAMHFRIADFLGKLRAIDRRQAAGDVTPVPASVGDGDAAVLKALEQRVSIDAANMPLAKFAEHVAKLAGVNVLVRWKGLSDAGLDEKLTISGTAKDQPLADALAKLLGEVDLKWELHGEVLVITTRNEDRVTTWVYPVADVASNAAAIDDDLREELPMLIESTVAPATWPSQTGPGPLDFAAQSRLLLIEQSADIHRQIGQLLNRLRATQAQANERRAAERRNGDNSDDDPVELQTYSASTDDAATGKVRAINPAEIVPVVRDLVEPKRWSEPGVSISALGDRIVVRHRRSVQRQVRELMQAIEYAE